MDTLQVKFKCSLAWLAGVVSACKQDLELSPVQLASLNEPFTSSKEVKQEVVKLLTNPSIYCTVYSYVSSTEQLPCDTFWPLIHALARKGVYLIEDDESAINDTVLSSSPFREASHIVLIEGMMKGFTSSLSIIERVVKAVRRISGLSASKELPGSIEEALLLWLNKTSEAVSLKHQQLVEQLLSESDASKRRQNRLKLLSEPGPVAIPKALDLTSAMVQGQCLPSVILYYLPEHRSWADFHFRAGQLSEEEVVHNLKLVRSACLSFLPPPGFHIPPEVLLWWAPGGELSQSITAMVALLFHHLEPGNKLRPSTLPTLSRSSSIASTSSKMSTPLSPKLAKSRRVDIPSKHLGKIMDRVLPIATSSLTDLSNKQQYINLPTFNPAHKHHNTFPNLSSSSTSAIQPLNSHFSPRTVEGRGVFAGPQKGTHSLVQSSLVSSFKSKKQQKELISASIENLIKQDQHNTTPVPSLIVTGAEVTGHPAPSKDHFIHRFLPPNGIGEAKSFPPKIKFIHTSPVQSSRPGFPNADHSDGGTQDTATERALSPGCVDSSHIQAECFVDLDTVPSQDGSPNANGNPPVKINFTLGNPQVTETSQQLMKENNSNKTPFSKLHPTPSSSPSNCDQCYLSIFPPSVEPASSIQLNPEQLLFRMKLRRKEMYIRSKMSEEENELLKADQEMRMRVFWSITQHEDSPLETALTIPAKKSPVLLHPQKSAPPQFDAPVMELRSELSPTGTQNTNNKVNLPQVIEPVQFNTQLTCTEAVVIPKLNFEQSEVELSKKKKRETIKARLEERDKLRRKAADQRKKVEMKQRKKIVKGVPEYSDRPVADRGVAQMKNPAQSSPPSLAPPLPAELKPASLTHTGPECYVKPTIKTNRKLIRNALCYVCLAGEANVPIKQKALSELDSSDASHFMILFRNILGCKFKSFYSYQAEDDKITRVFGTGPKTVTTNMIAKMFKYNSGAKEFIEVHSRFFSFSVDALTIQDHYWMKRKDPSAPNR